MPSRGQLVDLGEQRLRIDDDAVADDAGDAVVQDARRDQVQHELLAVDVDRVAGVVPALVAGDDEKCGVSRSTILPLPSSPHCAPSTAMFMDRYCIATTQMIALRLGMSHE